VFVATITNPVTNDIVENQITNNPVESQIVEVEIPKEEPKQLKTTKEIVEDYFKDTPVMIDIARCESRFRQFDANGNVLRGEANPVDIGVMQINEKYHAGTAVELGFNIYALEGNLGYAKYLYETKGTKPWIHSSKCWNSVREVAFANTK